MKKITEYYKKWNPSKLVVILILLFPLYFFLVHAFKLDNDFWFLVNTGKNVLQEGFINIEPFTIHEGLAYLPQQWLTCVIFYFIYHNAGIYGMYCFTIFSYFLITYIGYKLSYLMCESRKKSLLITLLINVVTIGIGVLTTRPQLLDLILFMLELYLLELFIKKKNKKYLYFIPLISLLLVNFHASTWTMLFVFILPYFVEYVILKLKKKEVYDIRPLILVTIISLAVGLINPYGVEGATYIFRSYGIKEINNLVNEMTPVYILDIGGKLSYCVVGLVFFSFYHNKDKNVLRYFFLALGTSYLFLSHIKGVIYFLIVLPLVLGYNFKSDVKLKERKMFKVEKIIYSVVILVFMTLVFLVPKMDNTSGLEPFADYLDKNTTTEIKLFTDYNDGGYMEYRGYKSYIDPRAEVFLKSNNKKEDIFKEYYNLCEGKLDAKDFLDKYQFDYLLVEENLRFLYNELKNSKEYEEVYLAKFKDNNTTYNKYLYRHK